MLYWKANFQIPNSGAQAADVYVVSEKKDGMVIANWYADKELGQLLFDKEYEYSGSMDSEDYLLTLEEYAPFIKI